MKECYKVGVVDDDVSKITQMIPMIRLCCNDVDGHLLKEKYEDYKLEPVEVALKATIDETVECIVEEGVDAVIIDYKLSSQQNINYTGVALAKALDSRLCKFPIFILTTYQDDLFDHELFDAYLVFDFERYIEEDKERLELNSKMIEQIRKYRREMEGYKEELEGLLPREGESASIDARIVELDTKLEKSIYGNASIAPLIKKDVTAEKINQLIAKIDLLIEGE